MKKALLISLILLLTVCCGCSDDDDGSGGEFNIVISQNPQNLDPQLAQDSESMLVIKNIYGTLMETDADGMTVCGAAKNYSVSSDGLEYTFYLREGLTWYGLTDTNETPLTADDYVYAFKRIFNAGTHSPYVDYFSNIKNALAVYNGGLDESQLGVKADDDYTLKITLENPNCDFLKLMAHPASSPCNEKLFLSTRGKYGLSAKSTFACGAFYVSDWNYDPYWTDNHINLEKIGANSFENYKTYPKLINIEITDDRAAFEKQSDILTDAYVIEKKSSYSKDISKNYSCSEYIYGTTCFFFAPNSAIGNNENVRRAILSSIDIENISQSFGEDSVSAVGIIPNAITVMNKSFRELYPENYPSISANNAVINWSSFKSENSDFDFNNIVMLVNDNIISQQLPHLVISNLEDNFDMYCMADFKNEADFNKAVQTGEYDFCITTISPENNSVDDFIYQFHSYLNENDVLSDIALQASRSAELSAKMSAVKSYEEEVNVKAIALPLSFEKKYLLVKNDTEDIWYDSYSDVMYFKYAKQF